MAEDVTLLHMLADAAAKKQSEIRRDVDGACNLAALPIDAAWSIEVYRNGIFWDASVLHKVGEAGFEVRFRCSLETAYVRRVDFMKTWRFPFDAEKHELYMLLVPDDHV